MKIQQPKDLIKSRSFLKQKDLEKYAEIGKVAHELFHDLLNPITSLLLYLDLIKSGVIPGNEIEKQSDKISKYTKSIRNFIKLIQNDNGKIKELDINRNLKEVMTLVYYKAQSKKISLTLISEENTKIEIEKIKLYRVAINLLSNSIDAYENISDGRKKNIVIKVEKISNYISISFVDNGCGIKKENIKNIFNKYYTNKPDGFGIGLQTVKDIIEKELKGKVFIESKINKGTIFKILIPKKKALTKIVRT